MGGSRPPHFLSLEPIQYCRCAGRSALHTSQRKDIWNAENLLLFKRIQASDPAAKANRLFPARWAAGFYIQRRYPMAKRTLSTANHKPSSNPRYHQRADELQAFGTVSSRIPLQLEEPV